SIKIENTTLADTFTLEKVTPSSTAANNKIKYCSPTDASCSYKTDSNCVTTGSLAAGTNCKIWFKSQNNDDANLYVTNDLINVYVKTSWAGGASSFEETTYFNGTTDQSIYAGGNFTSPGNHVAKWDGSNWSQLSSGTNGEVHALNIRASNTDLYAGGSFSSPGSNIARWNGFNWSTVTNEPNGLVRTITDEKRTINFNDNILYVGGDFTSPAYCLIKCDANDACSALANANLTSGSVYSLTHGGTYLYVGGSFAIGASSYAFNAYKTAGSYWNYVVTGTVNNRVYATTTDSPGREEVSIGGAFTVPGNTFGRWASAWVVVPGTNGYIYALNSVTINNASNIFDVYAGGNFSGPSNNIAVWHSSTNTWSALGAGIDPAFGSIYAITSISDSQTLPTQTNIYAGGSFSLSPSNYIAMWDGTNWSSIGPNNINGDVRALTYATSLSLAYDHYNPGPPSE
ncbi:MAG: hypothetical protein KKE11_02235, partial [Gammaproteobacteria bacterium]|nr:hypothetical protein [Gammaproteobacteria bacterium]